jgi:hypothetical protein
LFIAGDLNYLPKSKAGTLEESLVEINKMINGLIRSIENQKP